MEPATCGHAAGLTQASSSATPSGADGPLPGRPAIVHLKLGMSRRDPAVPNDLRPTSVHADRFAPTSVLLKLLDRLRRDVVIGRGRSGVAQLSVAGDGAL